MMHSDDLSADSWKVKRRKWNETGMIKKDNFGAADTVEVFPPLRLSQNIWAAAATGNDQTLMASEKEKQFAEGNRSEEFSPSFSLSLSSLLLLLFISASSAQALSLLCHDHQSKHEI